MALFNRRKNKETQAMPPEVQDYYQAEKRERTGVAWLLGLVAFAITVVLALAIFFGGRWLWRTLTSNDELQTTDTTQVEQSEQPDETEVEQPDETEQSVDDEEGATDDQPAVLPGDGSDSSTGSGDRQVTPSPQSLAPTQVPSAGDPLPDTGPAAVLTSFVVATSVGSIGHYLISRRRL